MDSTYVTKLVNNKFEHVRKAYGLFFTPDWVVDFMVNLVDINPDTDNLSILEPACGMCQFLYGLKRKKPCIFKKASRLVGIEINSEIIDYLHEVDIDKKISIIHADYLLWESDTYFDLIIGNPPYGIPSLSEHYAIKVDNSIKERYKQLYETWYGKYNVYGAFIEKSIKLLKEGGQLLFIVPATFMLLNEFKKLRQFLSRNGITKIIYMGSEVFKPEAEVTTVILDFRKSTDISRKVQLFEYENGHISLIFENDNWSGEPVLFSTGFTRELEQICTFRLGDVYTIRISPRTTEIKRNKYVIKTECSDCYPILNGKNLKIGEILYEPHSGFWIKKEYKTRLRRFFDKPHIVVGLGFRGNGRLAAAYDYRAYPWMGDVYHLLKKHTLFSREFDLTDEDVVKYLNSEIVARYIREKFREITYHFNIAQLSMIPLPKKSELEKLKEVVECQETGKKI